MGHSVPTSAARVNPVFDPTIEQKEKALLAEYLDLSPL